MNINNNPNNINFGVKLDTGSVLEVTSLRIFQSDGLKGPQSIVNALSEKPANFKSYGHKGFRHYAQLVGEQIMEKYPKLKEATEEILNITDKNPNIKKTELNEKIQPIINRLGKEIDITL